METSLKSRRAIGSLMGLAVGDALGTTLEFTTRDAQPLHTEILGGGAFGLEPGEWTDDTSMALCLADSLLARDGFDPKDVMDRYVRWWRNGENSPSGRCVDIGNTTYDALNRYEQLREPDCGSSDPLSAGNGSLMRLAPVPIFSCRNVEKAKEMAVLQSRTTHAATEAMEACEFFSELLVEAIDGSPKDEVLRTRSWSGRSVIGEIAKGGWKHKSRDQIQSTGYVVHSLEAAIWCVYGASSFEEALVTAVNLGRDADTVGAITGQLAGALWSCDSIPQRWLEVLQWREHIEELAMKLFVAQRNDRTRKTKRRVGNP